MDGVNFLRKITKIALDRMFADNNKIKIGDTAGFQKKNTKLQV